MNPTISKDDAVDHQLEHHDDDNPKAQLHSLEEAQAASAAEHSTTLRQALRENWKAVLWSAVISLTIVMEGYDQRFVYSSMAGTMLTLCCAVSCQISLVIPPFSASLDHM